MSGLNIILFGAPGCGKGTLSEQLVKDFHYVHLSAGNLLREEVTKKTPLGNQCVAYMSAGNLIPDSIIIDIVCEYLLRDDVKQRGVLLDGFPRTLRQAQALRDRGFRFDLMVFLDVRESTLRDRCLARRVDPVTGRIYNLKSDPPPAEIVERLTIRSDDTREKHDHRMKIYFKQKKDLLEFYANIVIRVDANGGIMTVYKYLAKRIRRFVVEQKQRKIEQEQEEKEKARLKQMEAEAEKHQETPKAIKSHL